VGVAVPVEIPTIRAAGLAALAALAARPAGRLVAGVAGSGRLKDLVVLRAVSVRPQAALAAL
jgi:hypothetical protein